MAASGALRELIAFLGFEVDDKPLQKADERLKGTLETAKKVAEVWAGLFAAHELGEFISGQIEMGASLERTSLQLGISIEDLEKFQYAAATVGVGTDEANSALTHFSRVLGEARMGNAEATQTLAKLGFTMDQIKGNDTAAQIAQLSEGFSKLHGSTEQNAISMKVLGRAAGPVVNLFKKGGDAVEKLYGEFDQLGGGLSEQFVEDAAEAEHSMVKLRYAGKGLSSEVGAVLLPFVSDLASFTANVVAKFREWTKGTNIVRNALVTLAAIGAGLLVIWGILNIEILLVVAALALLAIAVDDVTVFMEGGDSVLGRFLDKLYGVGKSKEIAQELRDAWKEVSAAFGTLWDSVKDLGSTLKDLFATFSDAAPAKTGIQGLADATAGLANHLSNAVKWLNELLQKFDKFAKDHPLLIHAVERSATQASKGLGVTEGIGAGGAVRALAGDARELFTGYTGDLEKHVDNSAVQVPIYGPVNPNDTYGPVNPNVTQHLETNITFNGVPNASDASGKMRDIIIDTQASAASNAFHSTGGGAP